ncbi:MULTISPECIES: hypothetical protein [Rhodococcus]|jgi:hypothetical protein|uniref:Uncharacterized protein n=2 Tax=Rhodococcus aetherivorans TaxID=191292 RepID=A0AA46PGW6_9NOCA|nr:MULTISPECIES: hypothetical protein [Rhodococcus]ETT24054.1 hypothetical protein RR21198_5020 [Rhodococcus rhodochrous ATCC 21198]AKE88313.1 hypothetical protein AAT18_02725 [Rhodococcus aetherivorans]ANZ27057.1 hypothetical protein A4U64_21975 [Rhodococcus sp. WB1]MBC2592123.1 hypothetical protein [Rhodococcus aetherivorans]MDV6296071.1 hypothetical protein [Rhodococcus aetherivorans]
MAVRYHVTSVLNRASISRYGLDWNRMDAAPGIAGSRRPEQQGCFLCAGEWERDWFVQMNNTGGAVDVWEVHGIDAEDLVESPEGHYYFPGVIPAARLRLEQRDVPPVHR